MSHRASDARRVRGRSRGANGPAPLLEKGKVRMDTKHRNAALPELSDNAVAVLKKRYLKKNGAGEAIEEPIIQAVRGSMRGSKKAGEIRKDYRVDEPKKPHRRPPYSED